jgi:hypothetical protein
MKTITLLFILLFNINLLASQDFSKVSIYSNPENIKIRLDSVIIGQTPLISIEIKPGSHILEAITPTPGLWNSNNQLITFHTKPNKDTTIYIRMDEKIKINSVPFHAKLHNEDRYLGLTPFTISYYENRGKTMRLEKEGYKTLFFVLNEPKSQSFKLEKIELNPDNENNSFTYSLFHKRIKSKFLFLTGTVAAHWVAFYFKNVADDNYNKYLKTTNPDLMTHYWDKTQKYDRMSDVSLVVSYAFLSGLIYTVVWD